MAEAEEVITEAARHTTVFVRELWRRHGPEATTPALPRLADVEHRLELLLAAVFPPGLRIRPAQAEPPPSLLGALRRRGAGPVRREPVPATDGVDLWLPPTAATSDPTMATERWRVCALQQAVRARRGGPALLGRARDPLVAAAYLLLEARAADAHLVAMLPGAAGALDRLRQDALHDRPPLERFPPWRRALEARTRSILATSCTAADQRRWAETTPAETLTAAHRLVDELDPVARGHPGRHLVPPLLEDWWTGTLRLPAAESEGALATPSRAGEDRPPPPSARLRRRPRIRPPRPEDEEDRTDSAAWMIQADEPHLHAEDPMGLQRPTDRDEETAPDAYADLVSDLPEARLVRTPGTPREILLTDDPPETTAAAAAPDASEPADEARAVIYPEWDYRLERYRDPGATVHLRPVAAGDRAWADAVLEAHRPMLRAIRRRFEMLRASRVRQRRQVDGEEIDLDAYIASQADYRAGLPLSEKVYTTRREADRSLAITLLIDVSGSTDSWIAAGRRVIDVEREALLLVGAALEGLGEPFAIEAFSGTGPAGVTVRPLKAFGESWSGAVASRIAALEPEHYTRAGAAVRHATAGLMERAARHRLLLLLSDGKPNDEDHYEGRYGVEDVRRAVIEARLQGVEPFCLTIDRQGGAYLPRIFGRHHYALLADPERLPRVLLEWTKRLVES